MGMLKRENPLPFTGNICDPALLIGIPAAQQA